MTTEDGKALIVEDEESWLELISMIVEDAGYPVLKASTGRQALALAAGEKLAFVVLDLKLPDMAGTDLMRCLREMPGRERLPVLVLTSLHREEARRLPVEGTEAFVSKDQGLVSILGGIRQLQPRH